MLVIPFANPIGPNSGPLGDGVLYGSIPQGAPVTALALEHLSQPDKVYRGNADSGGAVTFSDISAAANDDATGDVSIFDATNPTKDSIFVELKEGDEIDGLSFLVSRAAALAGTPVADVYYKTASGWASAQNIVTPLLTGTGLRTISFDPVKYADTIAIDDPIDPRGGAPMRGLFMQFGGITGVTTSPLFTRLWKRRKNSPGNRAANRTAVLAQGNNPDFSSLQSKALPVTGDLLLFGFDRKPIRLFPTLHRPGSTAHQKEWVYSKLAGSFATLPAARINDPSDRLTAALVGLAGARSVEFNGDGQDITSAAAPAGIGAFTISIWVLPTGSPVGANITLIDAGNHAGNNGFGIYVNALLHPSLRIRQDFNHYQSAAVMPLNEWSHLVITYDGVNTAQYYLNGRSKASEMNRTILPTDATNIRFGRREGVSTERFVGRLDEAQIYNRVLSQSEILALYNIGKGVQGVGTENGLVAAWHFDETTGSVSASYAGSFDGTITGATVGAAAKSDWAATASTHQVPIVPPGDWAKSSLTDRGGTEHSRYWVGFRTTADVADPVLPENFTLRGQPMKGDGLQGIPAPETTTYTKATIVARDPSIDQSTLLIINSETGESAEVVVPANSAIATAEISLAVTKGDPIVIAQARGHISVNLADGAIFLS